MDGSLAVSVDSFRLTFVSAMSFVIAADSSTSTTLVQECFFMIVNVDLDLWWWWWWCRPAKYSFNLYNRSIILVIGCIN